MFLSLFRVIFRATNVKRPKGISATTSPAIQGFIKTINFSSFYYGHEHPETKMDSDSEKQSQIGKGNGEFWRRKMRTFHGIIDINKDGVVSYDDFVILAERFVNLGHLSEIQQREFQDVLREVWEKQWGAVDRYNLVTTEQYLQHMQHVLSDKYLNRKAHHFLPYLFKAVDKDRDGVISVEEFKLFFECLGLEDKDAVHSFTAIDINKDGYLSLEEFVKLGREFFLTEDEHSPSKAFWGPLVNP
ncbi:sarcoplasmic calcium-binding protein [Zootermopsis nevadensis]|uniref:Sarcoplasmic calcium-binding protein n=1 Tax=Zootermopsis nevadensis TaxID=136037 RepID=A0A067RDQ2_ZOONE|nr:sarcoplasmic calcium-binding protein [Zootermopsis nevadensis]KDR21118.1 Sarcoplasmic calcium-binding protein [Zootermopsis nevadensis]